MIADYHALTTSLSSQHSSLSLASTLSADTISMARVLLASGVDTSRMCLFVQSQVPAHCELTWIFSCLGPMYWLNTMIQFKEKERQYQDRSSVGLFTYPVLMAVDILLYQANHVPVGVDQLQHIELTNKYAERFNKLTHATPPLFPKVK
jgi:tryptophanyl-tRNA synthetase